MVSTGLFLCRHIAVTTIKLGYSEASQLILPHKKVFQGIKFGICAYSYIFVCPVRLELKIFRGDIYRRDHSCTRGKFDEEIVGIAVVI